MRKTLISIFILLTLYSCNIGNECTVELEDKEREIEILNDKIAELEQKIEKTVSFNSSYERDIDLIDEKRNALFEEELYRERNMILKREVFYGMIENSDFDKYIESYTYKNEQNPSLSKVYLKIEGTQTIIDFYSHLYSQYHLLYLRNNLAKNPLN